MFFKYLFIFFNFKLKFSQKSFNFFNYNTCLYFQAIKYYSYYILLYKINMSIYSFISLISIIYKFCECDLGIRKQIIKKVFKISKQSFHIRYQF